MLILCEQVQNEPRLYNQYLEVLSIAVGWFKSVHDKFSDHMQNEARTESSTRWEVEYEILAKEKLLNTIEPLFRVALSKFSYGPSSEFFTEYDLSCPSVISSSSWIDSTKLNFIHLAEILAHVLKQTQTSYTFDLKVLASDRDQRNKIHQGTSVQCKALIRKYVSMRELLIFLDSDNENLPIFQDDTHFDYDLLISQPCSFSFNETATILIVDSVHDIPDGFRSVVANLQWSMVIDFDGYSDFGGLLSSVKHNSIRKEWLLANKPFPISHLDQLQTMWCRCGEYLQPHYHPKNCINIAGAQCFDDKAKAGFFHKSVEVAFKKAFISVSKLQRFVSILILSDNNSIAKGVIDALYESHFDDYHISWIGTANSTIEYDFNSVDGEEFLKEHFYHHDCSICAFFTEFYKYANNWEARSSIKIDYALPIGSGSFVSLSENTRNNLSPYFEVLYKDLDSVDIPDSVVDEPFQKGGRATWKDIATGEAVSLGENTESKIISLIKSNTGRAQQDCPQKNLFFVVHKAGIGGTTFVKQIAWKLHNDMAVLEIKHYDDSKTFQELQNLYDNIIEKNPILLIAEDTLPNLESICDAFLSTMKNRRCAFLIACRENNKFYSNYPESNKKNLLQLEQSPIDALKYKFKKISPLSKIELEEKEANFEQELSGDVQTPFLIGLYFLEKDFHIESYVQKVLDIPLPSVQRNMIALLALCDIYGSKYLPAAFVNKSLGFNYRSRTSLILSCPGAESLICRRSVDGIEVYYFKHQLLSTKFLELYSKNSENSISEYSLTKKLIQYAANCQGRSEQEFVIDTLLDILIRNRDRDNDDMSHLLLKISIPEFQRSLLLYLAEQFKTRADEIQGNGELDTSKHDGSYATSILRIVSHAYAHLGRLYAKYPANYTLSVNYFELAEMYMPYSDSYIYHMHGSVLYLQLCNEWDAQIGRTNVSSGKSSYDYEDLVEEAFELFDKTSEFGDVQYGIIGQLHLLLAFLKYIYRTNEVRTSEDISKLSFNQKSYLMRFIDVLDVAKQYDGFDDTSRNDILKMESKLYSNFLMGNYGKTIEYYQNEYDKLVRTDNNERAKNVLECLVSAKLLKAKAIYATSDSKQESLYQKIHDPRTLFEQIEILLSTLYSKTDFRSYVKRTSLFRHWFQLAKLLDAPVNEAMIKVRYWLDSENNQRGKKNPEPYYYKAMLLYLEKLEGGDCDDSLQMIRNTIATMDSTQQFDPKRGRPDKIRDLLVEGKEMGRLLSVFDCGSASEIAIRTSASKKSPVIFSGTVESVQYWGAEILIYDPPALMKQKASSSVGKMSTNTLSEEQTNHRVKFFAGFTVIGLRAVEDSVKDQDTGEIFNREQILSAISSNKGSNRSSMSKYPKTF